MPTATRRRHGLLPTTPIGQPFVPPPMPVARPMAKRSATVGGPVQRIPGSATLFSDRTGQPLAKVGDNPNGPEAISVTPPGEPGFSPIMDPNSPFASSNSSFASPNSPPMLGNGARSYAGGGLMIVGGSGDGSTDPAQARQLQEEQTQRNAQSQIYAAEKNVTDLNNTGMDQTLQNSENYKYYREGVATPTTIDVPQGNTQQLSPLVRPSIRSQADILTQQENERRTMAGYDNRIASLQEQGSRQAILGTGGDGGGSAPRSRVTSGSTGSGYNPNVPFNELPPAQQEAFLKAHGTPFGLAGYAHGSAPSQMDYQAEQDQKQAEATKKADQAMKDQGYVKYVDPNTRASSYLSPHDAAVRKAHDDAALKAELAPAGGKPGEFDNTSDAKLLDYALHGAIPKEQYAQEIQARHPSMSKGELDALLYEFDYELAKQKGSSIDRSAYLNPTINETTGGVNNPNYGPAP